MKAKRLAALLLVVAMLFTFVSVIAACDKHQCQHVCDVCGKCKDPDCEDPVCADKCQGHEPAPVLPTAIAVDPSTVSLEVGAKSSKPTLTFTPSNAANSVSWSSANTAIATVDNEGVITAVAPGSTVVSATSTVASGVKAEIQVTVSAQKVFMPLSAPVEGEYYFAMQVGNDYWYITGQMAATYYFGTTKDVNSAVKVQLVPDGDGWLIKQGDRFIEISISGSHINAVYKTAQTAGKHWTWDATEKVFVWDNQYIIGNTGTYTNIGGISLSDKATNHFAVLGVYAEDVEAEPESVQLNYSGEITLLPSSTNNYLDLRASVLPLNAPQDVTWSVSANDASITVENGRIRWTEEEGEATITATATGTNKSASVKVKVQNVKGATEEDPISVDEAIALLTEDGAEAFAGYGANKKQGFYLTGKVSNSVYHSRSVNAYWTYDLVGTSGTLSCTSHTFSGVGSISDGGLDNFTVVVSRAIVKRSGSEYIAGSADDLVSAVSATPPAVTGITIDDTAEVQVPLMAEIHVLSVQPANAVLDGTEQWHSDAEGIATVEKQGDRVYVTGVSAGTVHITVTVGEVTSNQCTVTVNAADTANKFAFDWSGTLTAEDLVNDIYTTAPSATRRGPHKEKYLDVWNPGQTEITEITFTDVRMPGAGKTAHGFGYWATTAPASVDITTTHSINKITFKIIPFANSTMVKFNVNDQLVNPDLDGKTINGKLDSMFEVVVNLTEATTQLKLEMLFEVGNAFAIVGMIFEW